MGNVLRTIHLNQLGLKEKSSTLFDNEWITTNGLGGYASASLSGATTRKYHGILVASLPVVGRTIMLNSIDDSIRLKDGTLYQLSEREIALQCDINFPKFKLSEFQLDDGIPHWIYKINGFTLIKKIFFIHGQNTVCVTYQLVEGNEPIDLIFRPYFNFRHHEDPVTHTQEPIEFSVNEGIYQINLPNNLPSFQIAPSKQVNFTSEDHVLENVYYRVEAERGYESIGNQRSAGYFTTTLHKGESICFLASSERKEILTSVQIHEAYSSEKERRKILLLNAHKTSQFIAKNASSEELILATDQFIVEPISRIADIAKSRAKGEEARTIIAGYHWFTDWGRDTMISLEGLSLVTGRFAEAEYILRTFSYHIKEGLIPNLFPDGKSEGIYTTADATLWFFHAIDRYYHYTKDEVLIKVLLPKLKEIIQFHIRGTLYGIHMDPKDGLLIQGADKLALTWMDARFGDLVITPRRGKAVEICALWYNALRLLAEWIKKYEVPQEADQYLLIASQCYESFNSKFWMADKNYLYDIVDGENGNDSSCRPNQLFAISLKYPVLKEIYWKPVINTVQDKLLTAYGLRTLSPDHPDFKVVYKGNLFLRDSAYHQGTVWPWLLGPFVDAWLKVHPDKSYEIPNFLASIKNHLSSGCIGTINEIFDADKPFESRGCVSQAWSVAEIIRCFVLSDKNHLKQ